MASAACAVALAGLAACSSFAPALDVADASPEASGLIDSGRPEEGVERDADASASTCVFPGCEDFETDRWKTDWQTAGAIALLDVNSKGAVTSGTRALDLQIAGDTPVILIKSWDGVHHLRVVARMVVVDRGEGDIDFINVVDDAKLGAPGLHLTYVANQNYAVEVSGGISTTLAQSFASYTRVELEVDTMKHVFAFTIGGQSGNGVLEDTFSTKPTLFVSLGASYAVGIKKAWHVRFDDVEVVAD